MSLGEIFEKLKDVLTGPPPEEEPNIRPASEDPQGDPADNAYDNNAGQRRYAHGDRDSGILPASQDPYGDPADQQGNIRPASEDPLGDPADQSDAEQGIRPASEDPLGDPADRR